MSHGPTPAGSAGPVHVLLLHGVGGSAAIWGERGSGTLAQLEAAGYPAVALDFPGYGARGDGVPTLDAMVAAVREVVEAERSRRWVLVGHSMGGMVAQEVVARAPAQVAGLVLACTSPAFGRTDGAWQAQFLADRLAPLEAGLGMEGMARQLAPSLVSPAASAAIVQTVQRVMAAVPERTYRAALRAIVGFDRREALGRIAVPTLVLAAAHDRTAPPNVMQRMAEHIAASEYAVLENAGHIANVEQPAAFHAALLDFLQRHF